MSPTPSSQKSAIGIDLGGTNLKGIVMNQDGSFRHLTRVPTQAEKGGATVLANILRLVGELVEKEGSTRNIVGVGIGTPGFVDEDGTVLGGAENLPGWKGTQIYKPILDKFGLRAAACNDVTVMALAESRYGAGRGVKNMVCLAMGTGIGGGIVINGHVYKGSHGMAGELGHISVETSGVQCNCGIKGCVECYASATGIVNLAKAYASQFEPSKPSALQRMALDTPEALSAKLIYDHAKDGDEFGVFVNDRACRKLAVSIGMFLNSLAPDRIVLGGGVMMAGQIIIDTVSKHVPKHCWPQIWERCDIVAAELGENAGVLGAAALAFDELSGPSVA
jgi:glucokinase